MVHFPHRSNQVGDETAAPVAQRNTNFNESFSLEALPDAAVTLTEPTSHFEKLDLTLEERLKADITAKQEVQHTGERTTAPLFLHESFLFMIVLLFSVHISSIILNIIYSNS
jgi:hypothetical protein